MNFRNNLSLFDLFGLFAVLVAVIYKPLSVWFLHFDEAERVPTFCCIFSFIVLFPKIWHYLLSKPFVFYLLLAVFQYMNGLIKGSYLNYDADGIYLLTTRIFLPFISLLLVYNAAKKSFDNTLTICTAGLFIYSLIPFVFGGLLSGLDRSSYDVNANEIALYCAISIGLFLLSYVRKIIPWYCLFLTMIPLISVIITASRMGFAMVAIMIVGFWYIITFKKRNSLKRIIISTALLAVFIVGFVFLMKYAEIGERMSSTTKQLEIDDRQTGTILDYFGDRGPQYYFSWPYFLKHPVSGIGIGNWRIYNFFGQACHSEYMVQYLEGGLISFILYCLFWAFMLKHLYPGKTKLQDTRLKTSRTFLLFVLESILFANLVIWSYDMYCVFVVYALVLGLYQGRQRKSTYRIISPKKHRKI